MIAKEAGQAIHIPGRFHIMAHLGNAIDELLSNGIVILNSSRLVQAKTLYASVDTWKLTRPLRREKRGS